jgi:SAM-dependent methyltransferase
MVFEYLKQNINLKEDEFNSIYPEKVKRNAQRHWTPINIAKQASEFLVDKPGTKVLDIGSGPGKFCMIGATYTKGHFTGVEQREKLIELSNKLLKRYRILNVNFIHANITNIEFKNYDAFYFFNSFYENIDRSAKIDDTIDPHIELYILYHTYIYQQFCLAKKGTRLVTYWSTLKEVPPSYELQNSFHGGFLNFWKKIS